MPAIGFIAKKGLTVVNGNIIVDSLALIDGVDLSVFKTATSNPLRDKLWT